MANNVIPDSIIMNMICRSLVEPQSLLDRSHGSVNFQEHLEDLEHDQAPSLGYSRPWTTPNLLEPSCPPQSGPKICSCTNTVPPFCATQVARGNKLISAYKMKID